MNQSQHLTFIVVGLGMAACSVAAVATNCFNLVYAGSGCDLTLPELEPDVCILKTNVDIGVNDVVSTQPPGQDDFDPVWETLCEVVLGEYDAFGNCVSPNPGLTYSADGFNDYLVGDNCAPSPGGGTS